MLYISRKSDSALARKQVSAKREFRAKRAPERNAGAKNIYEKGKEKK